MKMTEYEDGYWYWLTVDGKTIPACRASEEALGWVDMNGEPYDLSPPYEAKKIVTTFPSGKKLVMKSIEYTEDAFGEAVEYAEHRAVSLVNKRYQVDLFVGAQWIRRAYRTKRDDAEKLALDWRVDDKYTTMITRVDCILAEQED